MNRILKILPIFLLLIIFSCTQESNVLLSSPDDFRIETIEDGTLLEPGSLVNIAFSELGSRSTQVLVTLEDDEGTELASAAVDPEILKGFGMPLELPEDLDDGAYYLKFTVLDGDIVLYEEQRYLFVASGLFAISSLETYPPGIRPGDSISARVILTHPAGTDPWLRWTLDGEFLKEGTLADLGLTCDFSVPEDAGVYTLKVEVFPVPPASSQLSSVYRLSDLFVTSGSDEDAPWQFVDDRTYQYFIDFDDGMTNRMNPDDVPLVLGSPTPFSQGNYSGIAFDEEDGLIFNQYALPLASDGTADDFLMTMAFSYSYQPEAGVYNIFRTGDENTYFAVLYLAESREFLCEFRSYSRYFHSLLPLEQIRSSEAVILEVHYKAGQGVASLSWKNQGETLIRDEGLPVSSLVEGQTVIGRSEELPGFPMNWYTLGISTDNTLSADPVVESSENVSNLTLLYEKTSETAESIIVKGALLDDGLATLEIQSLPESDDDWVFTLFDGEGNSLYSLEKKPEENPVDLFSPENVVLSFINDSRGLFLSSSLDTTMTGPFDYQETLNFEILPVDGSAALINEITAVRLFRD